MDFINVGFAAHLIDVDVVVVGGVVDGFEEALELARRSSVNHQDEGDSHRVGRDALGGVVLPLDVTVGFTCAGVRMMTQSDCQIIKILTRLGLLPLIIILHKLSLLIKLSNVSVSFKYWNIYLSSSVLCFGNV